MTTISTSRRTACLASTIVALAVLAMSSPAIASADPLPNLVAVGAPDDLIFLTYAAAPTPTTLADAGTFVATMEAQVGAFGVPVTEPNAEFGSRLTCYARQADGGVIGIYGVRLEGEDIAGLLCSGLQVVHMGIGGSCSNTTVADLPLLCTALQPLTATLLWAPASGVIGEGADQPCPIQGCITTPFGQPRTPDGSLGGVYS